MNIIQKEINLNVRHPNNYQVIHAMQGDNDTIEITATIFDGNHKYYIDCDQIEIDCISPTGVKNTLNVKHSTSHTVTFSLGKNVLGENGEHKLSIHFMSSPALSLTTFPSILYVCNAPVGALSKGEIATITEYVLDAKKNAEEAKKYYEQLISEKGQPNGIATLDENGMLPLSQLSGIHEIYGFTEPDSDAQRVNDYWLQEY